MSDTPNNAEQTPPRHPALLLLCHYRIGLFPLPIFLLVALALCLLAERRAISPESPTMIAALAAGASLCAWLGGLVPFVRKLGGPALVCAFLPSYLVAQRWIPEQVVNSVSTFTKSTNFIYIFIAAVIVGSILGLDRKVLLAGMLRIFVPLLAGSLAACLAGSVVGILVGLKLSDVVLLILVPVMAGGVGDGAIPLSVGYAELHRGDAGSLLGQILPVVLLANFVAIVAAGLLNTLGKLQPALSGAGQLRVQAGTPSAESSGLTGDVREPPTMEQIASAFVFSVTLYLVGVFVHSVTQVPAPVTMLVLATLLKLTHLLPQSLERATAQVSQFFAATVTYPLLVAVAIALTPWASVTAALQPAKLLVIVTTVLTLTGAGFFVGRWMHLYPVESALINACHTGAGGTGDVAILTAAERMELLPFAQVATRIGGAITVAVTLFWLRFGAK